MLKVNIAKIAKNVGICSENLIGISESLISISEKVSTMAKVIAEIVSKFQGEPDKPAVETKAKKAEPKQHCPDLQVLIEQKLDFSRWVENGFGTGDCVIVADEILQIIDYEHGLGVLVSAEKNPQMLCYALGVLELFDGLYDIR